MPSREEGLLRDLRENYEILLRQSQENPEDTELRREFNNVKNRLQDERIGKAVKEADSEKSRDPLRRRILEALSNGAARPRDLSQKLEVRSETISRHLAVLADENCVTFSIDPDDQRSRFYSLTELGLSRLVRGRAFDQPSHQEALNPDIAQTFLMETVDLAVNDRRTFNKLDESIDRLSSIIDQSRYAGFDRVRLKATRELATTLRQSLRWPEFLFQVKVLENLASGTDNLSPDLILPAYAHWKYETGRCQELELWERGSSFIASSKAFQDLHDLSLQDHAKFGHDNWALRRAWSIAGIAEILRDQTEFGEAIDQAKVAVELFRDQGDKYGETHCLFIQGFCHKLRGQFQIAQSTLAQSLELAMSNGYNRHVANSLLQLGDVNRCLRNFETANELLAKSIHEAERLNIPVTRGYGLSALGSVHFLQGDLIQSTSFLEEAHRQFCDVNRHEGTALNLRRLATTYRHRRDFATAKKTALEASRRYVSLQSPAGMATSALTLGEIGLDRSIDQTVLCDNLVTFLGNRNQRLFLELDPWFPHLLRTFSRRANHESLAQEAQRLLSDANARMHENVDEILVIPGIELDEDSSWRISSERPSDMSIVESPDDEMAGEPRVHATKVAV